MMVSSAVRGIVVDIIDDGFMSPAGAGDQDFSPRHRGAPAPSRLMCEAGTLDNQFCTHRFPRNMPGLFLGINGNFLPFTMSASSVKSTLHGNGP